MGMARVVKRAEVGITQSAHCVDKADDLGGFVDRETGLEFPADGDAAPCRHLRARIERLDTPIKKNPGLDAGLLDPRDRLDSIDANRRDAEILGKDHVFLES